MKKVIYGFSGDPITYGHINIIKRDCHGNIWRIDNSSKENEKAIIVLFNNLTKEMKIK